MLVADLIFIVLSGRRERKREGGPSTNRHTASWLPRARQRGSYPCNDRRGVPGTPKEQTPFIIATWVLCTSDPQEEVAESEAGKDKEGSNKFSVDIFEDVRGQEDNDNNNQVEGTSMLNVKEENEEEVQVLTSPPKA